MGWIIFIKLASSKDIKTGCLDIKVKFIPFINRPWVKRIYLNASALQEYVVIFLAF